MSKHLVIMAAGTGGHIMPGLAVADEMKKRGWTVSWLGTEHGMETRLVPPAGIELDKLQFNTREEMMRSALKVREAHAMPKPVVKAGGPQR